MDMIRNISTQPFPELHCGALRIFTVSTVFVFHLLIFPLCGSDHLVTCRNKGLSDSDIWRGAQAYIALIYNITVLYNITGYLWICVWQAIATQPWGQKLMINTPGFMEFILDRSTGQTKEAKDAKFELIGALAGSSTAAEILGSQHYIRVKTYLREGPYYVSAVAAVSTEGAD